MESCSLELEVRQDWRLNIDQELRKDLDNWKDASNFNVLNKELGNLSDALVMYGWILRSTPSWKLYWIYLAAIMGPVLCF